MSFGVSDGRGDFEWAATLSGLFAKGGHVFDRRFHRMLADLVRFNSEARELIGTNGAGGSLRSFCRDRGFSDYFVERLIVPQASAVWSADPDQLWDFPVSFLAEFLDNHGSLQLLGRPKWRSVIGGSQSYVEAITEPWRDRVRLSPAGTRDPAATATASRSSGTAAASASTTSWSRRTPTRR